jgi:hypothetical protein
VGSAQPDRLDPTTDRYAWTWILTQVLTIEFGKLANIHLGLVESGREVEGGYAFSRFIFNFSFSA